MTIPRPLVTALSEPFWRGLAAGRIDLQQCSACDRWIFYPRPRCTGCGAAALVWRTTSSRASLYSFAVADRPVAIEFAGDALLVPVIVELDEGVRLPSTLEEADPDRLRIGMRLSPRFDRSTFPDLTLLRFAVSEQP